MAKRTTPKPQAAATAQDDAPAIDATATQIKIEEAAVPQGTQGSPTPPPMGNEGTAAEAGEGQSSLANSPSRRDPEDMVTMSDAVRASILVAELGQPQGEPSLIVTGPKKGRWRIGHKFGPEPVTLLVDGLTEEDMKALAADPTLTIKVVAPPF